MAGLGRRTWTAGEVVTAANVQGYLQDQTVMVFADASARDAAITAPTEGMVAYLSDSNTLTAYTGSAWVPAPLLTSEPLGNRNIAFNGAMQVAQRGTSTASITTGGYYTVDRWALVLGGLGTWTMSQESDAPTGSGFANSLKVLCTTADSSPAAGDFFHLAQGFEGQDLQRLRKGSADALPVTVSFWVKSNVTGTYIVELRDSDNTRTISASYTVNASATWEFKTVTFAGDTTGALDDDNNASLGLHFWLGAGSNYTGGTLATSWAAQTDANRAAGQTNLAAASSNYFQITGVQFETGRIATPFEHRAYGEELGRCQRYFQRYFIPLFVGSGDPAFCPFTTTVVTQHRFSVEMRTAPVFSAYSGSFGIDNYGAALGLTYSSQSTGTSGAHVVWTTTGATAGRPSCLIGNGGTTSYALNAEL
jgi:hypothetical protein